MLTALASLFAVAIATLSTHSERFVYPLQACITRKDIKSEKLARDVDQLVWFSGISESRRGTTSVCQTIEGTITFEATNARGVLV